MGPLLVLFAVTFASAPMAVAVHAHNWTAAAIGLVGWLAMYAGAWKLTYRWIA